MELDLSRYSGCQVYYVDAGAEACVAFVHLLLDSGLQVEPFTFAHDALRALRSDEKKPLVAVVVAAPGLPGGTDAFLREVYAIDPRITRIRLTDPSDCPVERDPEVCEQMLGKDQLFRMEVALLTRLFQNLCRAHVQSVVLPLPFWRFYPQNIRPVGRFFDTNLK